MLLKFRIISPFEIYQIGTSEKFFFEESVGALSCQFYPSYNFFFLPASLTLYFPPRFLHNENIDSEQQFA